MSADPYPRTFTDVIPEVSPNAGTVAIAIVRKLPREPGYRLTERCADVERARSPVLVSWWAVEDSNLRPHPCEGCALAV